MMRKLRKRVKAAFYIGYNYAYVIVNTEDRRSMIFFTNRKRVSLEQQLCCSRRIAESARV